MDYIDSQSGPSSVRLYSRLMSNQDLDENNAGDLSVYSGDVLLFPRNTPYGLVTAFLSSEMFCYELTGGDGGTVHTGHVDTRGARATQVVYDPREDWDAYGSLITKNSSMLSQGIAYPSKEKGVIHTRFNGALRDQHPVDYIYRPDPAIRYSWFGASGALWGLTPGLLRPLPAIIQVGNYPTGYPRYYLYYGAGTGYDAFEVPMNGDSYEFLQSLGSISSGETTHRNGDKTRYTDVKVDVTFVNNTYRGRVSYIFGKENSPPPGVIQTYSSFSVTIDFTLGWVGVTGNLDDSNWVVVNSGVTKFAYHTEVVPLSSMSPSGPLDLRVDTKLEFALLQANFLTQPYGATTLGVEPRFYAFRRRGSPWFHMHESLLERGVKERLEFLRPSGFIAASDAFDDVMLTVSSNLLQNIQHLKNLTTLIPDLVDLPRLIARASKGDIKAILEIIDIVTSEILRYRFQQAPLERQLPQLADELKDISDLLGVKTHTGRGVYRWTFPDEHNFMHDGTLTLETRAKVCFSYDLSTAGAALLLGNQFGVLPTFARLWELLPFSFVIDWLFNMKKRLKLVDNQVGYLAVRTNYVLYSYKIVWYPSDALLNDYNLSNVEWLDKFSLSTYVREFSRTTPRLVDSPYDFLRPSKGPDPITVGALMYQLCK